MLTETEKRSVGVWELLVVYVKMKTSTSLDGLFVVGSSIAFVDPGLDTVIFKPWLQVKSVTATESKGSRIFSSRTRSWKFFMFYVGGLTADAVFTRRDGQNVDFSSLIVAYCEAVNKTVDSMRGTRTFDQLFMQSGSSFQTYKQGILIYPDDFSVFAMRFAAELRRTVHDVNDAIEVRFIAYRTGQAMGFEKARPLLIPFYSSEEVEEVVLHICTDYTEEKCLVLFKKKELDHMFGKPALKFFPGAIRGVGNFYYKGQNVGGSTEATLFKFYSFVAKYVNHNNPHPFRASSISGVVFEHSFSDKTKQIERNFFERMEKDIHVVNKFLVAHQHMNCPGRFELLFSSLRPTQECVHEIEMLTREYNQNIICANALLVMSAEDIFYQISSIVIPALNTVSSACQKVRTRLPVTWEEICSVMASEALICFMLYGTILPRSKYKGHPSFLKEKLFPQGLLEDCDNMGAVCMPKNITITPGKRIWFSSNIDVVKNHLPTTTFAAFSLEILEKVQNRQLLQGAKLLAQLVVRSSVFSCNHSMPIAPCEILQSTNRCHGGTEVKAPIRCDHFIQIALNVGFSGAIHRGLWATISSVRKYLYDEDLKNFTTAFTAELENFIASAGLPLGFQLDEKVFYVIVPWNSMTRITQRALRPYHAAFDIIYGKTQRSEELLATVMSLMWQHRNMINLKEVSMEELFTVLNRKLLGEEFHVSYTSPLFVINHIKIKQ